MKVTALAGGVGGAKLLVGLQRVLGRDLTAIVNTGDDALIYGVHVCPDVDIVTYWLSGIADRARGFGIEGDTYVVLDRLKALGVDPWFALGDRDLATCIYRTRRFAEGAALTSVTDEIRTRLGATARVLPMSDDEVRTRIVATDGRTLDFQEYFVRERCEVDVAEIRLDGVGDASPAPGVLDAIRNADRVIVCPSNPLLSVAPIVALDGIRAALIRHAAVTAVTPIVRGAALKGPADRLLARLGHGASASAVARMYADFCDRFVIDASDPEEVDKVESLGIEAVALQTVMRNDDDSERLARALVDG